MIRGQQFHAALDVYIYRTGTVIPLNWGMIKADASFNCARSVLRPLSTSVNVANISPDGVIWWLRERCGKSEEVHSALKSDLAGGQMPSGLFGANAPWWALASWRSI